MEFGLGRDTHAGQYLARTPASPIVKRAFRPSPATTHAISRSALHAFASGGEPVGADAYRGPLLEEPVVRARCGADPRGHADLRHRVPPRSWACPSWTRPGVDAALPDHDRPGLDRLGARGPLHPLDHVGSGLAR